MQDFWIEYRCSDRNFNLHRHFEHRYQVVLVTQGRVRYIVGEKEYTLSCGSMIVLNTLEEHTLEVLEYPYARYLFQIAPEFFQNEIKYPEIISIFISRLPEFSHMCTIPPSMWDGICQRAEEMLQEFQRQDPYWKLMTGCGLRMIFIPLFRACPKCFGPYHADNNAELAFKVQNYLDKNYVDDINVGELAKRFFVHKSYLSHTFKEVTGYSVMSYVISLRLNRAKALLMQGSRSISEIAVDCGYADFAHFSRQFKKHEHCSPSDFRKKHSSPKGE